MNAPSPQLRQLAEDLYCAEGTYRAPGGVVFSLRSTIIRTDAGVIMLSPIPFDHATAAEIDALGPVVTIIAPNRLHHLSVDAAQRRWPEAQTLAAPGLPGKRSDLRFDAELEGGLVAPGLHAYLIEGAPAVSELVFLHEPSRTLVVTDLVFHVHKAPNLMTWLVLRLVARTLGRLRTSRLWTLFRKDRAALSRSVLRVLELEFDRLVMAHGEVVETGGREALAEGTAWLVGAPRALPRPGLSERSGAAV